MNRRRFLELAAAGALAAAARAAPSSSAAVARAQPPVRLDAGSVRKRVPLEEHDTAEFTPVRS